MMRASCKLRAMETLPTIPKCHSQVDDLPLPTFVLHHRAVQYPDDIRMPEPPIRLHLPHRLLDSLLPRGDEDLLQRIEPAIRRVLDEVDEGEAAFAEETLDLV